MRKPKAKLHVLPSRPILSRQVGIVEMKAPGEEQKPWGRITIELFDSDEPMKNTDMIYALEAGKAVVFNEGFSYGRKPDASKANKNKGEDKA